VDGALYLGGIGVPKGLAPLKPGNSPTDIALKLDESLREERGVRSLRMGAGKHVVRVSFRFKSAGATDANPGFRVTSNRVEIEILPATKAPADVRRLEGVQLGDFWKGDKPVFKLGDPAGALYSHSKGYLGGAVLKAIGSAMNSSRRVGVAAFDSRENALAAVKVRLNTANVIKQGETSKEHPYPWWACRTGQPLLIVLYDDLFVEVGDLHFGPFDKVEVEFWRVAEAVHAALTTTPPAEAKRTVEVEFAGWLTSVSLKDGTLTYVWHTVKPGMERAMNPANYDRHEFSKRLSDAELARFSEWIDTRRVFSLPTKFEKEESTGYAVQAGARFFVSRGENRYEKKLDGRGEIPKEFSDATAALVKLCESIRDGVRTDLAPELRDKRDKLLAQADATIRKGLLELGEKYPQMKKAEKYWESLAGASSPGRIGITYFHSDQGKAATMPKGTVPEKERVSVLVVIKPPPEEMEQLALFPLYPNLGLVGWVGTSAGDPELDAALKKLVDEALKPLAELNAASAEGRSRPPEAKDAADKPPPQSGR
jgi:hypothetical protein